MRDTAEQRRPHRLERIGSSRLLRGAQRVSDLGGAHDLAAVCTVRNARRPIDDGTKVVHASCHAENEKRNSFMFSNNDAHTQNKARTQSSKMHTCDRIAATIRKTRVRTHANANAGKKFATVSGGLDSGRLHGTKLCRPLVLEQRMLHRDTP